MKRPGEHDLRYLRYPLFRNNLNVVVSVAAVVRAHPFEGIADIRPQRAALLLQPVANRPRRHQLKEERRHLRTRRRGLHRRRVAGGGCPVRTGGWGLATCLEEDGGRGRARRAAAATERALLRRAQVHSCSAADPLL